MFTTFEEWFKNLWRPIAGAEDGDGDGDGDGSGDGDGAGAGAAGAGDGSGDGNGDGDGSGDGSGNGDGEGDGDDDEVAQLRAKLDKSNADLAAAQRAAREAKKSARDQAAQAAQDSGNWEQVAKSREGEITDLREQLGEATDARTAAEYALDQYQRKVRVATVASKLQFRDPADAIAMLNDDDSSDDKSVERALRKLIENKPYLVDQRRATGRGMNGGSGGNGAPFSREQLDKMSADEINGNWEKISASLERTGGR